MPTHKVMIAQFPGGNSTHPDVSDWVTETVCKMRDDPSIGKGNIRLWRKSDTPITLGRNMALACAEKEGADYVLMIDNDLSPDLPIPGAEPFWDTTWKFVLEHDGPCVVAAPYNGPPPDEMTYVFRFTNTQSDNPNPNFQIEAYPRAEAASLKGIQRAAALPTGLMLIDMRAIRKLPHPRFYYEWKDDGPPCPHCGVKKPGPQIFKASTEDVTFSRDLYMSGIPIYCNWSAYAGHWKGKCVGRPQIIPHDAIPAVLMERAKELARGQS